MKFFLKIPAAIRLEVLTLCCLSMALFMPPVFQRWEKGTEKADAFEECDRTIHYIREKTPDIIHDPIHEQTIYWARQFCAGFKFTFIHKTHFWKAEGRPRDVFFKTCKISAENSLKEVVYQGDCPKFKEIGVIPKIAEQVSRLFTGFGLIALFLVFWIAELVEIRRLFKDRQRGLASAATVRAGNILHGVMRIFTWPLAVAMVVYVPWLMFDLFIQ